ncbi:MAG: hypothetical protein KBD06_03560 [Candidatus Pacebacteria bacterium]|nr:hypothetical protein [Candidatus Paceibacterota bacterium]
MADEKTGNDASNKKPNTVVQTGAPGKPVAPVPSPDHPPVSHIMPRSEVIPTEPVVVPPGPPVSNIMPDAPETKIELTLAPQAPVTPIDIPPAPSLATPSAPIVPPVPPAPKPPEIDTVADDVGLVIPGAHSKPPDRVGTADRDMQKILQGIKLPEKRAYTASGDKKAVVPDLQSIEDQKLNDVLAANITENSTTGGAPVSIPNQNHTVPAQAVFHEEMHVASVHTLKQDLQQVVQEQKMSVVKAVALEQEKRQQQQHMIDQEPPRPPSRAPMILFTVLLFVVLGMGALAAVYYIAVVQSAPGPVENNTSLVFAEQTVPFRLTQDSPTSLRTQLAQTRTSSGTLGSLLHIVPIVPVVDATGKQSERAATLSEFFASIGVEPPENLMRALGDEFFLGIHTVDKNAPIFVIKVSSYDRAFDGMLTWERTLNGDLAPLFTAVPRLIMGPDGIQVQRPFTDLVMRNYDVRAIKDDEGVIQLYYSFPTRDLLIIAESPYTFTEILSRLQAGRRL